MDPSLIDPDFAFSDAAYVNGFAYFAIMAGIYIGLVVLWYVGEQLTNRDDFPNDGPRMWRKPPRRKRP